MGALIRLPRVKWSEFLVTPATLLRWHRCMVAKRWTYARRPGRPRIAKENRALIVRLARDNPRWGYQRLVGELKRLGIVVSATTVKKILRQEQLGPAGKIYAMALHRETCLRFRVPHGSGPPAIFECSTSGVSTNDRSQKPAAG